MGLLKNNKKNQDPIVTTEDFIQAFNSGAKRKRFSKHTPTGFVEYGSPLLVRRRMKSITQVDSELKKFENNRFGM